MAARTIKFVFGDRVVHALDPRRRGKVSHHCGRGVYMVIWDEDCRHGRIHGRFIRDESLLVAMAKAAQ